MRKTQKERGGGVPSQRQLRVGEELRHALARILAHHDLRDPVLQDADITVTEVRISPDLKNATAFVMPLGGRDAPGVMAALQRGAAYLRGRIAREVPLRFTPSLRFALDTAFDHASRIEALLHSPKVERDLAGHRDEPAEDRGQ
ncbi:MAG TPA: 30S ribosome-binding factor RbfA [Stellaceae bacterium]|nr:30S ribosome-binding factor RbfA [Stellaceae bacterium]